ncbi:MAG: hypothetical protein II776_02965 [Clostridia bacterium]|nr:hypothetical protein [Clostridia bacterium]
MSDLAQLLSYIWIAPWRDELAGVLWAFWLGVVLAAVYTWYRRATVGRAVAALREKEARDPATAVTPAEAGLTGFAARALKGRDRLFRWEEGRCYLPEETEKKAAAAGRIGPSALWQVPLVALGAYALLVAAYYIIPLF